MTSFNKIGLRAQKNKCFNSIAYFICITLRNFRIGCTEEFLKMILIHSSKTSLINMKVFSSLLRFEANVFTVFFGFQFKAPRDFLGKMKIKIWPGLGRGRTGYNCEVSKLWDQRRWQLVCSGNYEEDVTFLELFRDAHVVSVIHPYKEQLVLPCWKIGTFTLIHKPFSSLVIELKKIYFLFLAITLETCIYNNKGI